MTDPDAYNPEDVRTILRVSVAVNKEIYRKLKEEGPMEDAFEWVFHEELTAARNDGIAIGEARGRAEGEARGRAEGEARGEARGRAEGEARGEARGIFKTLSGLVRQGLLSLKDAAKNANMSETDFTARMAALDF